MQNFFEIVVLSIIGAALLFGFTIFFRKGWSFFRAGARENRGAKTGDTGDKAESKSITGESKTCPVCSSKLSSSEQVSSSAFPSLNGGNDRLMHIRGCIYCLRGDRERVCPVCRTILTGDDILICRLFERPGRRIHVHVLGCTKCRGPRS